MRLITTTMFYFYRLVTLVLKNVLVVRFVRTKSAGIRYVKIVVKSIDSGPGRV